MGKERGTRDMSGNMGGCYRTATRFTARNCFTASVLWAGTLSCCWVNLFAHNSGITFSTRTLTTFSHHSLKVIRTYFQYCWFNVPPSETHSSRSISLKWKKTINLSFNLFWLWHVFVSLGEVGVFQCTDWWKNCKGRDPGSITSNDFL